MAMPFHPFFHAMGAAGCSSVPSSNANKMSILFKFTLWRMHPPKPYLCHFNVCSEIARSHANAIDNLISIYSVIYSAIFAKTMCFSYAPCSGESENAKWIGSPNSFRWWFLTDAMSGWFVSVSPMSSTFRSGEESIFARKDDLIVMAAVFHVHWKSFHLSAFRMNSNTKLSQNDEVHLAYISRKSFRNRFQFSDFWKVIFVATTFDKYLILFMRNSSCESALNSGICGRQRLSLRWISKCTKRAISLVEEAAWASQGSTAIILKAPPPSALKLKDVALRSNKWISFRFKRTFVANEWNGLHWNSEGESSHWYGFGQTSPAKETAAKDKQTRWNIIFSAWEIAKAIK